MALLELTGCLVPQQCDAFGLQYSVRARFSAPDPWPPWNSPDVCACVLQLESLLASSQPVSTHAQLILPRAPIHGPHGSPAKRQAPSLLQGGGVYVNDGQVTFTDSSINGNTAEEVSARLSRSIHGPMELTMRVPCVVQRKQLFYQLFRRK
jgi:hypothetical protein